MRALPQWRGEVVAHRRDDHQRRNTYNDARSAMVPERQVQFRSSREDERSNDRQQDDCRERITVGIEVIRDQRLELTEDTESEQQVSASPGWDVSILGRHSYETLT